MCGFLFYNNLDKKIKKKELHLLKEASKLILQRGPDYNKSLIIDNIFLFHSRLNIIDDTSKSNQPMVRSTKDGKFHLVYNGEIYNFKELKKKMVSKIC